VNPFTPEVLVPIPAALEILVRFEPSPEKDVALTLPVEAVIVMAVPTEETPVTLRFVSVDCKTVFSIL
jgi:hypothetical protein